MGFESFVYAHNRLLNLNAIFQLKFLEFGDETTECVSFNQFLKFLNQYQGVCLKFKYS